MKRSLLLAVTSVSVGAAVAHAQSLDAGVKLFEAKKYNEAKAFFIPYSERNAEAAYYIGRIVGAQNQDNAAYWFDKAMKMDPGSSIYVEWYGRALGDQASRASKFKLPFLAPKVKGAFEKAIALDPDNIDAREDLMEYYIRAPGVFGGSREKARGIAIEIKRRNAYRGGLAVAGVCAGDNDPACAERELVALESAYPDSAMVYAQLAGFYANEKQFDKSFAVIDGRLKASPDDKAALFALGRTAGLSGLDLDRGEKALKSYLLSPPAVHAIPPSSVHFRLGMIYEKAGKREMARSEYVTALQFNPRSEEAKKALAALGR